MSNAFPPLSMWNTARPMRCARIDSRNASGSGGEVPVEDDRAFVRKYAEIHPASVEVDAAVERATLNGGVR